MHICKAAVEFLHARLLVGGAENDHTYFKAATEAGLVAVPSGPLAGQRWAWHSDRHPQRCTGVFSALHTATVLLSLRATLLDSLRKAAKL